MPSFAKDPVLTRRAAVQRTVFAATATAAADSETTVEPREIDDLLVNPGLGFETFHCFNGDREVRNYPACSIAYFRFYWDQLEPEENQYAFGLIDELLAKARARGQDLALRFMAMDTVPKTPTWYRNKGGIHKYMAKRGRRPGTQTLAEEFETSAPDFNSPYFFERQEALVQAFARRFNGHPDLLRMEIGSIGRWGEWHTSGTPVPMPTEENALRAIDWYFKYWDRTPLVMLIGYVPGLRHAVANGAGWRADSLGDYGHFRDTWSHMIDYYPKLLQTQGAQAAWKRGMVTFEPPGTMEDLERYVPSKGGGYDAMWKQALEWGASSFNGKSQPIPDSQVAPMLRFLRRCGYRLVLRSLTHSKTARSGGTLGLRMEWDNIGVAPPYRAYVLAVRLKRASGNPVVLETDAKLTTWLPGRHRLARRVPLPDSLPIGEYQLAVGVLDPHYREPEVKLAIAGMGADRWYTLSSVKITKT